MLGIAAGAAAKNDDDDGNDDGDDGADTDTAANDEDERRLASLVRAVVESFIGVASGRLSEGGRSRLLLLLMQPFVVGCWCCWSGPRQARQNPFSFKAARAMDLSLVLPIGDFPSKNSWRGS
jgi:hypothetical protein